MIRNVSNLHEQTDEEKVKGTHTDKPKENPLLDDKKEKPKLSDGKTSSKKGNVKEKLGKAKDNLSMSDTDNIDDTASDMASKAGQAAKDGTGLAKDAMKGVKHAAQNAKNAVNNIKKQAKKTKERTKRLMRVLKVLKAIVVKAVMALVHLVIMFWPVILALVAGFFLTTLVFKFMDTSSIKGNMFVETETVSEYNAAEYDEEGQLEITDVTMANKLVRAFYTYFSEKSIWVITDGTKQLADGGTSKSGVSTDGEAIQYRSQAYIDLFGDPDDEDSVHVGDKYNRESQFYINPNALYVLDKYMHDGQFRFPEQIVKHVAYEKNTGSSGGDGVFVGNGNEEICWNYYRSIGYSEVQTAGLLGNIYAESSFNTEATNGSHFGIHQWGGGRFKSLKSLADEKGKSWTDITVQLEFAKSELTGNYYLPKLENNGWNKSDLTVTEAADLIRKYYEVCGEQAAEKRRNAAQQYYEKFAGKNISDNSDSDNSDSDNDENTTTSTNDAYAGWKQTDDRWGNMLLPGGGSVRNIGCYATSSCVLAAYAGATSKDETKFNPKIGINQLSYAGDALVRESISKLGDGSLTYQYTVECSSVSRAAEIINKNLEEGYFYIVRIGSDRTHFMPVLGVTDNDVIVNDVGRASYTSPTNLSEVLATDGRSLTQLRVYKSSKTNMKECGNVSYEGGNSSTTSVSSVPYKLAQLTDDKRDLIAESTKYEPEIVEEKQYIEKIRYESRTINSRNYVPGAELLDNYPKEVIIPKGETKEEVTVYQKVRIPEDAMVNPYTNELMMYPTYTVKVTYYEETGTEEKTYYVKTEEKEKGVWDYGFGSVVSYKQYEEKQKNVGYITNLEVWMPDSTYTDENGNLVTGQVKEMTRDDYLTRKNNGENLECVFDLDEEYTWGEQSSDSYMIDWAITPAGTITNAIDYSWQDTGTPVRMSENAKVTKPMKMKVRTTETKTVRLEPGESKSVVVKDVYGEKVETKMVQNKEDTTKDVSYEFVTEKDVEKPVEFSATVEGTIHKIEPRYSNDNVDTSGITGVRYYEDYLYNYNGYVPVSIQGKFNFDEIEERTGKEKDELLKILETQSFTKDEETSTEFFDEEGKYIGIGSIQARYERGADIGDMDPGHHETDGITPGWGVSNFDPESCNNFLAWLRKKDSDFYNKYFAGVNIDTNSWQSGPFVDAWEKCGKEEKEQFTLYQISYEWKTSVMYVLNSSIVQSNDALSQIDFNRSYILQELVYNVCCAAPKLAQQLLTSSGITALDTDADIIRKVGARFADPSFYQRWYPASKGKDIFWTGVENRWSPDKKDSQTNVMLNYIEENGEGTPYEWDDEQELFTGGGNPLASSDSKLSSVAKKTWNGIKKFFENQTSKFMSLLYGTDTYHDILEDTYWTRLQNSELQDDEVDWVLSAMFAYNDQNAVTKYTVDDEYFQLMYEQMFSSQINNNGGTGSGIRNIYFSGKGSSPLKEDTDAEITEKYDKTDNPVVIASTKSGTKVTAVAEGKVIQKGYDPTYGGRYIMIQHSRCVSIYGNLMDISVQDNAKVKEGDVIGKANSDFYFALRTKMNGSYINPTELFSESSGGDGYASFVVPANGMAIPTLYQIDYPQNQKDFPDGSSIYWAGCGFTSSAMVASYLTGKEITPKDIANQFGSKYFISGVGMDHGLPSAIAKYYNLGSVTTTTDPNKVMQALSDGKPVMCSQGPGIFTRRGHIIVLRGTDGNGNVYVNDPASRSRTSQTFNFKSQVHATAKKYWIFEGK